MLRMVQNLLDVQKLEEAAINVQLQRVNVLQLATAAAKRGTFFARATTA